MIIVNFKRYPEALGDNAVVLAKICKRLSHEYAVPIVVAPTLGDLSACVSTGVECWTQKFEEGSLARIGTLLNHSDFRLDMDTLKEEINLSKSRGDKVCLCSANPVEVPELLSLNPNFLAYEPPELIGSKDSSVAEANPEVIGDIARLCQAAGIPLLVGAGIKSAQDVKVSLEQRAIGILVASAVVEAEDQEQKLRELAKAFKM